MTITSLDPQLFSFWRDTTAACLRFLSFAASDLDLRVIAYHAKLYADPEYRARKQKYYAKNAPILRGTLSTKKAARVLPNSGEVPA
jgi:hypothetical protein